MRWLKKRSARIPRVSCPSNTAQEYGKEKVVLSAFGGSDIVDEYSRHRTTWQHLIDRTGSRLKSFHRRTDSP